MKSLATNVQIIRERVLAGLQRVRPQGKRLGRPTPKVEDAIRAHLRANGILKVARLAYSGGHFADVRAAVFAPKNTLRT